MLETDEGNTPDRNRRCWRDSAVDFGRASPCALQPLAGRGEQGSERDAGAAPGSHPLASGRDIPQVGTVPVPFSLSRKAGLGTGPGKQWDPCPPSQLRRFVSKPTTACKLLSFKLMFCSSPLRQSPSWSHGKAISKGGGFFPLFPLASELCSIGQAGTSANK